MRKVNGQEDKAEECEAVEEYDEEETGWWEI